MKIVYLGTPQFAILPLQRLYQMPDVEIVGVICQPPKIGNRNKINIPMVKAVAEQLGLATYEFDKLRKEGVTLLKSLSPDLIITCAYGQILSQEILDIAKYGVLNIHASLLPKYRGAAPINFALLNGDSVTGVTVMKTVKKLDAGDILLAKNTDISEDDNSLTLGQKLSQLGADAISEAISLIKEGKAVYIPQNESQATYCGKLTAQTEIINWNTTATAVSNSIRALAPKPAAYSCLNGKRYKILSAQPIYDNLADCEQYQKASIGEIYSASKKGVFVKCGCGALQLDLLLPEGGKQTTAKDLFFGRKLSVGQVFYE